MLYEHMCGSQKKSKRFNNYDRDCSHGIFTVKRPRYSCRCEALIKLLPDSEQKHYISTYYARVIFGIIRHFEHNFQMFSEKSTISIILASFQHKIVIILLTRQPI